MSLKDALSYGTNLSSTFRAAKFKLIGLTFGIVAGFKHVQLVGVVGEGEDFDHRIQDHHNPENKADPTCRQPVINSESARLTVNGRRESRYHSVAK